MFHGLAFKGWRRVGAVGIGRIVVGKIKRTKIEGTNSL